MKYFIVIFTLALISLIIYSCSYAGIEHYYKSGSDKWLDIKSHNHDSVFYGNNNKIPFIEVTGKDSFKLYNIKVAADTYRSFYTSGIYYISISPDFFHWLFCFRYPFQFIIKFDVAPNQSNVKIDGIKFYINGDSVQTIPNPTYSRKDYWLNTFYFQLNELETEVEKLKIEFKNVTINGTKIEIPDLILVRDWRFFHKMFYELEH